MKFFLVGLFMISLMLYAKDNKCNKILEETLALQAFGGLSQEKRIKYKKNPNKKVLEELIRNDDRVLEILNHILSSEHLNDDLPTTLRNDLIDYSIILLKDREDYIEKLKEY